MRSANRFAVILCGTLVLGAAIAQERSGGVRLLVQSAPLAGLRYYAAFEVWQQLRAGDPVELWREPGNPHDPNAIAVAWRGRKLGYVPKRDNAALAWGLDRGERLQARISRLAPQPNPARRIEIQVFVE
jgi:HIRAN domain